VFPNNTKENPKSYDLKGTITTPDGKNTELVLTKLKQLALVNFQLAHHTTGCTELKS